MTRITDPQRARRLARAICSDVLLYNREAVAEGIRQDDLFERLRDEFAEARAFFAERVDPELVRKDNFIDRAIVDVLLCGSRDVPSRIW